MTDLKPCPFCGGTAELTRAELEAAVLAEREIRPLADGDPRGTVWIFPLTPLGADNFGVCIGGRWDGWLMWRHPDGQWVSKSKLTAIDPFSAAIRSQGEKK